MLTVFHLLLMISGSNYEVVTLAVLQEILTTSLAALAVLVLMPYHIV